MEKHCSWNHIKIPSNITAQAEVFQVNYFIGADVVSSVFWIDNILKVKVRVM